MYLCVYTFGNYVCPSEDSSVEGLLQIFQLINHQFPLLVWCGVTGVSLLNGQVVTE
eukprot:m.1662836 g.1662836  ORF g.1662836 m.1662836 type:complete len:56 (-) comp132455_c0_seq1:44-211(-)